MGQLNCTFCSLSGNMYMCVSAHLSIYVIQIATIILFISVLLCVCMDIWMLAQLYDVPQPFIFPGYNKCMWDAEQQN